MTERPDVAAAARAAGKNIGEGARELGVVTLETPSPQAGERDEDLAARARAIIREEIERMARMRAQYAEEKSHGAPAHASPRLDAMAANIEGACRFALRLGLLTPGEARQIWADARQAGLHDRPSQGRPEQHPETRDESENR